MRSECDLPPQVAPSPSPVISSFRFVVFRALVIGTFPAGLPLGISVRLPFPIGQFLNHYTRADVRCQVKAKQG